MIRTQIQLTEEQSKKLEIMATVRQSSKAEVVRVAIDRLFAQEGLLGQSERMERSLEVVGKFSSGYDDISVNHDEHLAEIFGEW